MEKRADSLSPIVLFVYNRPWHTEMAIKALKQNELSDQSELFIFSDGPKKPEDIKKIKEVREFIRSIDGFKKVSIIERDNNWGLARSIISGVSEIIDKYGKVIVMEDDLITSPYFLNFMNDGLDHYENNSSIMSISGWNLPQNLMRFPDDFSDDIYINYRNSSQGWATWREKWKLVDWDVEDYPQFIGDIEQQKLFNRGGDDLSNMLKMQMEGKLDSWAIRYSYAHYKQNMYSICPRYSYVTNIGNDGTGTHMGSTTKFDNDLSKAKKDYRFIKDVEIDEAIMQEFRRCFEKKPLILRLLEKISSYMTIRDKGVRNKL